MDGQIAHALKVGEHAQGRDELAQVGGNRLLGRQQEERTLLDHLGRLVDVLVAGDDCLGDIAVGLKQRARRFGDGLAYGAGEAHQVVDDGIELFVILISHGSHFRQTG